ncbi:unnamed protein product [Rhizophagus irregularis]|nr:unnamed protein product [Rhizophagus irregularis]
MQISQNMQSELEVYDLTITEKETTLQNSLETTLEPDENTKWYKVVISGIDEFLVEIHASVIALAQNELFFRIAIMS